jgi:hypothetical protein
VLEPTATNPTGIGMGRLWLEMVEITKEIEVRRNAKEGLTKMHKDRKKKN